MAKRKKQDINRDLDRVRKRHAEDAAKLKELEAEAVSVDFTPEQDAAAAKLDEARAELAAARKKVNEARKGVQEARQAAQVPAEV